MARSKLNKVLIICTRILLILILVLTLGYGILLTLIGINTRQEINEAKASYTPITVQITLLRTGSRLSHSVIVELKPEQIYPDIPEPLGRTIATTTNAKLAVGDKLTMYYNPQNPQERVIDFQTAEPLIRAGLLLTGFALLLLLLILLVLLIRRKKHPQPTAITGS